MKKEEGIILIIISLILLSVFLIMLVNNRKNIPADKTSCLLDSDCACGSWLTGGCAVGNKEYIDVSAQCPDFCTGIAGNLVTKCVDSTCKTVQEQQGNPCTDSGGTIQEANCCLSSGDFPNTCLIGACGCSPSNSHAVKICNCPEGECWDGDSCVGSAQADEGASEEAECNSDSDCVANECCHPKDCVPKNQEPDCTGMICTAYCAPGSLDCGQGSCVCDEGVCKALITTVS